MSVNIIALHYKWKSQKHTISLLTPVLLSAILISKNLNGSDFNLVNVQMLYWSI